MSVIERLGENGEGMKYFTILLIFLRYLTQFLWILHYAVANVAGSQPCKRLCKRVLCPIHGVDVAEKSKALVNGFAQIYLLWLANEISLRSYNAPPYFTTMRLPTSRTSTTELNSKAFTTDEVCFDSTWPQTQLPVQLHWHLPITL